MRLINLTLSNMSVIAKHAAWFVSDIPHKAWDPNV